MARGYELIVFDWDGTLMDSAAAIVRSIQAACRDLGVCEPEDARARHVIGLGLHDALAHAVPDLAAERYSELAQRYRHHYLSRDHELALFDGMYDLIEELAGAGVLLAVATGKSRLGLGRALEQSGLGAYFHATRCADECHSKPHPAMLLELMEELAVPPERTLMIGDTLHDLQMAGNAGVAALAVAYGAHSRDVLAQGGALDCVDTPGELVAWLRQGR